MVTEVNDVILHQESQRDHTAFRSCARLRERIRGCAGDHVDQVPVVGRPERRDVTEWPLHVSLALDPVVPVIALEDHRGLAPANDETPMVVARRVDEVA